MRPESSTILTPPDLSDPAFVDAVRLSKKEQQVLRVAALLRMARYSRRGLFGLPVGVAIVGFSAGRVALRDPWLWGALLLLIGLAIWRGRIARDEPAIEADTEAWRWRFGLALTLSGLLFTASILRTFVADPELVSIQLPLALLAIVAIVSQGVMVYSPDLGIFRIYSAILFAALPIGGLANGDLRFFVSLSLAAIIFYIYLWVSGQRLHQELWSSLVSSRLLERSRKHLETEVDRRTAQYRIAVAELRTRERDYRQIFDGAHDAILIFEPKEERVLRANRAARELYGVTHLVGRSMEEFSVDPDQGRDRIQETQEQGGLLHFESRQKRANGEVIHVEINANMIEIDDQAAILSINRDITERKQSESLRLAKEAAEEADRAKSAFLAHMSHEIRTPIAGVIGLADLLLSGDLPPRERHWAQTLESSSRVLLELIEHLLDFSKIDAHLPELEAETFSLRSMILDLEALLRTPIEAKGLRFDIDIAPAVPEHWIGDPVRLRQVLFNLLGNATKFTEHGTIGLSIDAERLPAAAEAPDREPAPPPALEEWTLTFTVHDTGIGIAPELLELVFEPFQQADASTSRRFGGVGLGLAISRRLVDLMDGTISVESRQREGSTFVVSLPLPAAPPPNALEALPPPREAQPRALRASDGASTDGATSRRHHGIRILVAEDNPVNQMVTSAQLQHLGYQVETVDNGQAAVSAVRESEPFHLVLMDCQMPEMDGYAATRALRQLGHRPQDLPIVALTAHALPDDRRLCLDAGMDDYLSKPFTVEQLCAVLDRWLPDDVSAPAPGGEHTTRSTPPTSDVPLEETP